MQPQVSRRNLAFWALISLLAAGLQHRHKATATELGDERPYDIVEVMKSLKHSLFSIPPS